MTEPRSNPTGNFFLLAGPCIVEGEEMTIHTAGRVVGVTEKPQIPYAFGGSYCKANRPRPDSLTGIGDEKTLKMLKKVRDTSEVPMMTGTHSADKTEMIVEYVSIP